MAGQLTTYLSPGAKKYSPQNGGAKHGFLKPSATNPQKNNTHTHKKKQQPMTHPCMAYLLTLIP